MAGVAHDPKFAKKVGIPQSVGEEFNQADKGTGILKAKKRPKRKRGDGLKRYAKSLHKRFI